MHWVTTRNYAQRKWQENIVDTLLDSGADINSPHYRCKIPVWYAASEGQKEIVDIFFAAPRHGTVKQADNSY